MGDPSQGPWVQAIASAQSYSIRNPYSSSSIPSKAQGEAVLVDRRGSRTRWKFLTTLRGRAHNSS